MRRATFEPRASVRGLFIGGLLAALALLIIVAMPARAQTEQPYADEAAAALAYIAGAQNTDGGFPAFGGESSVGSTVDAIFAFVAADQDPAGVTSGGNSPFDYLETQTSSAETDPGTASKLAFGLAASGVDASSFGGLDLYDVMDGFYDPATGEYGEDTWDLAFYILTLAASAKPVPAAAIERLQSIQQADGGWEFSAGFGTDTNTTALMLQSLVAGDVATADASFVSALEYFGEKQHDDAGWDYDGSFDSEASSTAFVIQGLLAAGENIDEDGPWVKAGVTPLAKLVSFQNPDTGAFVAFDADNLYATYQAVPAILLAPFDTLEPSFVPTAEPTASPSPGAMTGSPTPAQLPSTGGPDSQQGTSLAWLVAVVLAAGAATGGLARATIRLRRD